MALTLSAGLNQSHEDNHLLSRHHLHRLNTDMEFRDPSPRPKKKAKHRHTGRKPKPSETGADAGGERVDSTGSRPESEPHVVAGGSHDQGGKGSDVKGGQTLSTIQLPQLDEPSSMPGRGSVDDQEKRRADVGGGEVEQAYSHLRSDVEVAEEDGPTEEKDGIDGERVERVDPSPSTTSILHDGKPSSA